MGGRTASRMASTVSGFPVVDWPRCGTGCSGQVASPLQDGRMTVRGRRCSSMRARAGSGSRGRGSSPPALRSADPSFPAALEFGEVQQVLLVLVVERALGERVGELAHAAF